MVNDYKLHFTLSYRLLGQYYLRGLKKKKNSGLRYFMDYHLFTFKYTHHILFKAQEYLCLAIFEKPMIQVYGKTILSMEFKSIIKARDSNPRQFIHPKPNSHCQYQKPNSHWQHQSPILIGNIKAQFQLSLVMYFLLGLCCYFVKCSSCFFLLG